MRVSDILREKGHDVIAVSPENTLEDVVAVLTEYRIGAAVVLRGTALAGIVSERDIMHALATGGATALEQRVEDAMVIPVHVCELDDAVDTIMGVMTRERIRHLPVMHGNHVVGMISIGDVVKRRVLQLETEASALTGYITSGR